MCHSMYLISISVFERITTIVYEEMLSLLPTVGYRWHRLTEIVWTGILQCMFPAGDNKLIKLPNAQTIF